MAHTRKPKKSADLTGWRGLMVGITHQAIWDVMNGDEELAADAGAWLLEEAPALADLLDVDGFSPNHLEKWVTERLTERSLA